MRTKYKISGYSAKVAKEYIDDKKPTYCLSTSLTPQMVFEDGKPTDEVAAYKAWFVQEGQEPFQVKFLDKISLPSFLKMVSFEELEACEVRYNVYFKAKDVQEIK